MYGLLQCFQFQCLSEIRQRDPGESHTSILTCIFSSDLGGWGTGLSHPDTVTGQHSELIFHPGVQTHNGCSQSVPIDHLRN